MGEVTLFHTHTWEALDDGGWARTCPTCCRVELHDGTQWKKLEGVTKENWPFVTRRIIEESVSLSAGRSANTSEGKG